MALYHKHRPQLFSTIIGQDHINETLKNQVKGGKVAHAYLFSGPRGVGKTTTARVLAKAVNCRGRKPGEAEPCDECDSCHAISASRAIDVIEMDAASNTGVDNVREQIIDTAYFQPTQSPYKIFIIDEVHMLSTSAFNALLKTLEEPPAHLFFILATTELHKLPDTIISRCQRFAFKKIPYDVLKNHLDRIAENEGVHISPEVIQKIIRKSDGCARDAVNLLDQVMATGAKHITPEVASLILPTSHIEDILAFLDALQGHNTEAALATIHTVSDNGLNIAQFAHDLIECLRVALIMNASGNAPDRSIGIDLSPDDLQALNDFSKSVGKTGLVHLIDLALQRRAEIKSAPIPELPLELLAVEWCAANNPSPNSESLPAGRQGSGMGLNQQDENPQKKTKSALTITLEQAQTAWQECTKKLEADSPSLVSILKMTSIQHVNANAIHLTVPYQFHKDKLEEKSLRLKIEQWLAEFTGSFVILQIELAPSETKEIEDMAALLGGEIVNA